MFDHDLGWMAWPLFVRLYKWDKKWHGDSHDLSPCRVCIAVTGGCCIFPLCNEWKIVVLPSEAKRIAEYTGLAVDKFIDTSPLNSDQLEEYTSNCDEDPLWARLFSVWEKPTGLKEKCPFLKPGGCTLPYRMKPFMCQMYPLNFNITSCAAHLSPELECLLIQRVNSMEKVLECFGDNSGHLHERLRVFRGEFTALLHELEGAGKSRADL